MYFPYYKQSSHLLINKMNVSNITNTIEPSISRFSNTFIRSSDCNYC